MKLLKVSVPNFRNLKDVELTFEPDLSPAVFPIASQNGGGKSTLLQLIFILFSCSENPDKHQFVQNIVKTAKRSIVDRDVYDLASFAFLFENESINFNFRIYKLDKEEITYSKTYKDLEMQRSILYEALRLLIKEELEELNVHEQEQVDSIKNIYSELEQLRITSDYSIDIPPKILSLVLLNLEDNNPCSHIMICYTDYPDYQEAVRIFVVVSRCIFLAAPSTQPYLFLDRINRRYLLSSLNEYYKALFEATDNLSNLYLYNHLTVKELTETFGKARDKDWKQALKSNNLSYGSNIKRLTEDFHDFLGHDKYILPTPELDSVIIQKQISETERIELEPEDLSHGELRRLGLYAWIKYNIPENSIILIDEVENALHPDWQYNIADELASWGDNQYLLATHSFHLCEALTPKHVKEIEPKMCKPSSEIVD